MNYRTIFILQYRCLFTKKNKGTLAFVWPQLNSLLWVGVWKILDTGNMFMSFPWRKYVNHA